MKKLFIVVSAFSILLCCVTTAFADEETPSTSSVETVETPAGQTVVVNTTQAEQRSDSVSVSEVDDPAAHSSGSLPDLVGRVFGTYTPRTQTVTVYLEDGSTVQGTEIIPGVAGMDWYWISGVFLFSLVLWSFFRFLGVIFSHG